MTIRDYNIKTTFACLFVCDHNSWSKSQQNFNYFRKLIVAVITTLKTKKSGDSKLVVFKNFQLSLNTGECQYTRHGKEKPHLLNGSYFLYKQKFGVWLIRNCNCSFITKRQFKAHPIFREIISQIFPNFKLEKSHFPKIGSDLKTTTLLAFLVQKYLNNYFYPASISYYVFTMYRF